jgi:hypothetical protein
VASSRSGSRPSTPSARRTCCFARGYGRSRRERFGRNRLAIAEILRDGLPPPWLRRITGLVREAGRPCGLYPWGCGGAKRIASTRSLPST